MPLAISTTIGLRPWWTMVDKLCDVIWKPPSPQITSGRRCAPNEAPTAALTERPIDAQTALQRNAPGPLSVRLVRNRCPAACREYQQCFVEDRVDRLKQLRMTQAGCSGGHAG